MAVRPAEDRFARYVVKMATGSGKTKVMSLAIVWSYFNALHHPEVGLPPTFLLIAPNVIVYERLADEFANGKVFREDPLIPREWESEWQFSVVLRDDASRPSTRGCLFLTNVHQLYAGRDDGESDEPDEIAAVMPPPARSDLTRAAEMRQRIIERGPVLVLNDEGHHLHNDDLKWAQIINDMHAELGKRSTGAVAAQFDFTATPRHQDGRLFREIIVDYPIAQAVDDGIVKTPLIGELRGDIDITSDDASVRYRDRINAGVSKWRQFNDELSKANLKPVMFVMAENTTAAGQIADYLETLPGFAGRVLEIHTNARGEIVEGKSKARKEEIEVLRQAARKVDSNDNPYAAIVSVLMLREGWDVKNVVVIVPLRAYTAKANILPEQTLGRGLRRMTPPASGDIKEQVVVIEHAAFKNFWKKELEEEGLDVEWVPVDQVRPLTRTVVVDRTRLEYDIEVPILAPALVRSVARLDQLRADDLELPTIPLPARHSFADDRILYTGRHMFTLEVIEEAEFEREFPVEPSGYLSVLVRLIERETRLTGQFARLAPLLKRCIETRLFGQPVSMDDELVMRALNRPDVKKALFETFVLAINDLSIEEQTVALEPGWIRASETNAFTTTRQCVEGKKTIFNLVPCDSQLEADFANFLESPEAEDVLAYFKNETAVHFDIEYQGFAGGLRKYRPDFVVRCGDGVTYLVETKGHEDQEVERKDRRARRWCEDAAALTGQRWAYLKVPEGIFRAYPVRTFGALLDLLAPAG
ncbi:MAG: DEAD/DEAH box helicase family protein, partial [Dehalococcoidia bacterium]